MKTISHYALIAFAASMTAIVACGGGEEPKFHTPSPATPSVQPTVTPTPSAPAGAQPPAAAGDQNAAAKPAEGAAGVSDEVLAKGATVYKEYCQTCHQAGGEGTAGVFPPLANSDFLKDKAKSLDAILNGLQGEITVNGQKYNNVMVKLPSNYDNEAASAVINYAVQRFGGGAWTTTADEVAKTRK
ncbi:MAG: cytochrome c [Chlorobi bacterium]|nr:cytochrome c [Chlorobiota bacterium]